MSMWARRVCRSQEYAHEEKGLIDAFGNRRRALLSRSCATYGSAFIAVNKGVEKPSVNLAAAERNGQSRHDGPMDPKLKTLSRWSTISIRMWPLAAQFLRQLFRRMRDDRPQLADAFV